MQLAKTISERVMVLSCSRRFEANVWLINFKGKYVLSGGFKDCWTTTAESNSLTHV